MRILLADDHHVVREAIAVFIRRTAPDIDVAEASTLEQALDKVNGGQRFDAILLDFHMPGMNGLAGLDAARLAAGTTPIAILSGQISVEECCSALERGAAGVILKEMRGTALLSALREIVSGATYIPGSMRQAWESRAAGTDAELAQRSQLGNLTPREMDCVRLLMRGSTNRQIADLLALAEVTVKLHLHSAYKKMGARNRSDAVRIAMLKGLAAL
jgi:DNA-binding NarL/FixJ family response regulator